MRKVVALLLFVLLSAFAFGQDKYDIYEPLLYEPDVYVPKDTGAPLDMHPYVDTTVVSSNFASAEIGSFSFSRNRHN